MTIFIIIVAVILGVLVGGAIVGFAIINYLTSPDGFFKDLTQPKLPPKE